MFDLGFNLIKIIKRNLFPFYKNKNLKFVFKTLQQSFTDGTVTARFVGGCVRKHLTNDIIDDIDIATTLSTDEIKKRFNNTNFKVIDTGIKHGTVTLVSDQLKLELTTLRKDIKTDGRHAQVEYIDNWKQDSERRDFTINAIYLDINGKIFDPQKGTIDLKNNNLKFIGDPQKRIEEDFLRIIRFMRFKIMYNSNIEPTTDQVIKYNLNKVKQISKERILAELFKILELKKLAKNYNLKIIEDAAESLGSTYKNKHLGTFGDIGVLSFNGNKIITTGGGGALLTNSLKIAKKLKYLSTTAKKPHRWKYEYSDIILSASA